jgi:hypothetical protein
MSIVVLFGVGVPAALVLLVIFMSFKYIGPTQVGLVLKRIGKSLPGESPIAFKGEAGYQAELLMPGLRFRLWPIYGVSKHPWVQVPAGQVGVVISQIGEPLQAGAKSGVYKPEFGLFSDINPFLANGGQKGVQRPVLPPGTLAPMHPLAWIVVTKDNIFGEPISDEAKTLVQGIDRNRLLVTIIEASDGVDKCGIVTVMEGPPVEAGDIASRLGGFTDIVEMEANPEVMDGQLAEALLSTKNSVHNNYQDFQAFLDRGGRIGLQHDPLMYGAYLINPILVRVEIVPMVTVEQGEVAVVKAYLGLPTVDISGSSFKHGSMVRPGHRGLWQEPLRTGKYALNPHLYQIIKVPTAIVCLNWAERNSAAHDLDKELKPIGAISKEGFPVSIDLEVQIHVPDTMAPRVISRVGSVASLVQELLQGAVGNHFRNELQRMEAIKFISERNTVQKEAEAHVKSLLGTYEVEVVGVFIQAVRYPETLTSVLQAEEIARREVSMYEARMAAEKTRSQMMRASGEADMQKELAAAELGVQVETSKAAARKAEADGEAAYVAQIGEAKASAVRAEGLALAEGYKAQVAALGQQETTRVNIARELASSGAALVPNVYAGGASGGSMVDALLGLTLSNQLGGPTEKGAGTAVAAPAAVAT